MTHPLIADAAQQLHLSAQSGIHQTRSIHRTFHASSFVTRFKRANNLSSHRTAVQFQPKEQDGRDLAQQCLDYVTEVHSALVEYGPARVLNMDETPVGKVEAPVTAVVCKGSKQAAKIMSHAGSLGTKTTTVPCITAAGGKLQLCAIMKGKTDRCFNKIREGASAAVNQVKLYHGERGWMTNEIMCAWIRDVVQPYTKSQPAALILDSYKAHWSEDVLETAASINLELIQVPPGFTSTLQPLDVAFNGPMLKIRQRLWSEKKQKDAWAEDTQQAAIERAQISYAAMSVDNTRNAFKQAQLLHAQTQN